MNFPRLGPYLPESRVLHFFCDGPNSKRSRLCWLRLLSLLTSADTLKAIVSPCPARHSQLRVVAPTRPSTQEPEGGRVMCLRLLWTT